MYLENNQQNCANKQLNTHVGNERKSFYGRLMMEYVIACAPHGNTGVSVLRSLQTVVDDKHKTNPDTKQSTDQK